MPRPTREPPIASSIVPAIVRHAASCAMDTEALALRFDLPPDVATAECANVALDTPNELLQAIDRAASRPDVALHLARELTSRRHKLVELAVRAHPTCAEALVALARWTPLIHEGLAASVTTNAAGTELAFSFATPRRPRGVGAYVHELALAHAFHHLRASAPVAATRVWFSHPRPSTIDALCPFFQTSNLTFGQNDTGFTLTTADAARPMTAPDPATLRALVPLVDAELQAAAPASSFAARVSVILAAALPEPLDIAETATRLHMSARTLQRRLEDEATSFTAALETARRATSEALLANPALKLDEIAARVGFSDLATFSRAFKRWTGKPPGQWRRS